MRAYCRAYHLRDLRRFDGWTESRINWKDDEEDDRPGNDGDDEFSDDDIVYVHQDFTVTKSIWPDENLIFNDVNPEWEHYCRERLAFKPVPYR